MTAFHSVFFSAVVFATLFCGGSCINCFYCSSVNNSACLELDIGKFENITVALKTLNISVVNCSAENSMDADFSCRTVVKTILHTKREPEVLVTRGCGWLRDDRDCYSSDNQDHLETVCQCFTNYCNSADVSADPASSVLLFLVFSAVLYFYR